MINISEEGMIIKEQKRKWKSFKLKERKHRKLLLDQEKM
jgi:hypothetical protein